MSKYINEEYDPSDDDYVHIGIGIVQDLLNDMPSADVVEVKHGEWVYQSGDYFTCTNCGGDMVRNVFPFCPWCGANMGERKESKVKKCFDIPKEVAEKLLEDTERKDNE